MQGAISLRGLPSSHSSCAMGALTSACPCPCTGSATLSKPCEHSLTHISQIPGASSHQPHGQFAPAVLILPEPNAYILMQTPSASKQERAATSGREALRSIWINNIFHWLSWTCKRASSQGLTALSTVSCFTQRNSGR